MVAGASRARSHGPRRRRVSAARRERARHPTSPVSELRRPDFSDGARTRSTRAARRSSRTTALPTSPCFRATELTGAATDPPRPGREGRSGPHQLRRGRIAAGATGHSSASSSDGSASGLWFQPVASRVALDRARGSAVLAPPRFRLTPGPRGPGFAARRRRRSRRERTYAQPCPRGLLRPLDAHSGHCDRNRRCDLLSGSFACD
jgi:hypothetical protein